MILSYISSNNVDGKKRSGLQTTEPLLVPSVYQVNNCDFTTGYQN